MKRCVAYCLLTLCLSLLSASAEEGLASWYGGKFQGRKTASGEIFDTRNLTAAHKTLPFDTLVRVVNLENDREITVRINDRGPFVEGRVIDLSRAAADAIGMAGAGITRVRLEVVRSAAGKIYTVQVAAYSIAGNARNARDRLTEAGLTATLVPSPRGFIRVQVQNVPEEALEETRRLSAGAGFPSVLIILD